MQAGSLRATVQQALVRIHPGLEIVDGDLELGEGASADMVAVDSSGRLLLVLVIGGGADAEILRTLQALTFLRLNGPLLVSHYRIPASRSASSGEVLLVAETFTSRFLQRYAGINTQLVRALELRTLRSSSGEFRYLTPAQVPGIEPTGLLSTGVQPFLRSIPEELKHLAEVLARRLVRIDDQLDCSSSESEITWSLGGEILCSLSLIEGRIEGRVGPHGRGREIGSSQDIVTFVDEVLTRYLSLLSPPVGGTPAGTAEEEDDGPLLTPEELAAFEQPT